VFGLRRTFKLKRDIPKETAKTAPDLDLSGKKKHKRQTINKQEDA
jgi:hypothetical protein